MNFKKAVKNIRRELKTYIEKNNIKSLILGVSGGIDSCLCAVLAKPVCDELKIPLIGATLPSSTNETDENIRAKQTCEIFCHEWHGYSIESHFRDLMVGINPQPLHTEDEEIQKNWKIRNGNLKARLRMIYLYNLASLNHGMVLSTDNFTEYLLGFFTLHGDQGDFGMIQELYKSEVYDMAEWLANNEYNDSPDSKMIILNTIYALATDGLGVTDKGDLGQIMPNWKGNSRDGYKEVDKILQDYKNGIALFKDASVYERHQNTEFKRKNPVNIPRNKIFKNEYYEIYI